MPQSLATRICRSVAHAPAQQTAGRAGIVGETTLTQAVVYFTGDRPAELSIRTIGHDTFATCDRRYPE